ncbi:MAG: molecular chaperone HtpG, partial [Burkholderiaceae bacterium]
WNDPLETIRLNIEGTLQYQALLFLPERATANLFSPDAKHGVQLYVNRVFVMDDAEELLPGYLRFVKGVVDSQDLALNVSREILQQDRQIEAMRKRLTKRVIQAVKGLAGGEPEKYTKFWGEFGRVLKEGIGEDFANKEKIAALLRFASTHADTAEEGVSLADYVGRMKEGQDKIYYVTAETFNAARNSPHLEIFRKKGLEVLLLSDRVDEWVVGHLTEFDKKPLVSVAKGGLDLGALDDEAERKADEVDATALGDLVERVKKSLGDRVKDVRTTRRLTDSPACLVADEHDVSGNLARMLKAAGQRAPEAKPILEINPKHPVIERLVGEHPRFDAWAQVLYDQALLAEGGQLDDPATFVKRINELMLAMAAPDAQAPAPSPG